ncbi:MAG TPA: hypothetical protein VH105_15095 [Burkholderiales bacterium]|jgi:hypothetical protein|nr:hypothetical protein [Burkholderiales bacterium]
MKKIVPPEKPALLKAGIWLAGLNLALNLGLVVYQGWTKAGGTAEIYLALSMTLFQALLLATLSGGYAGARMTYVAIDVLEAAVSAWSWLHGGPMELDDIGLIAMSVAVWVLLFRPASSEWFGRAYAERMTLRDTDPAQYSLTYRLMSTSLLVRMALIVVPLLQLARSLHVNVIAALIFLAPLILFFLAFAAWSSRQAAKSKNLPVGGAGTRPERDLYFLAKAATPEAAKRGAEWSLFTVAVNPWVQAYLAFSSEAQARACATALRAVPVEARALTSKHDFNFMMLPLALLNSEEKAQAFLREKAQYSFDDSLYRYSERGTPERTTEGQEREIQQQRQSAQQEALEAPPVVIRRGI